LQSLYALLVLAAVALLTLLAGEIYYAFEDEHAVGEEQGHGVLGSIFDLAWLVFVPTFLTSLLAGISALIAGWAKHTPTLMRYGIRATVFCAFALAVVAVVATLQA
jgi:hypothetical protein